MAVRVRRQKLQRAESNDFDLAIGLICPLEEFQICCADSGRNDGGHATHGLVSTAQDAAQKKLIDREVLPGKSASCDQRDPSASGIGTSKPFNVTDTMQ
jgi:hypothetical protein